MQRSYTFLLQKHLDAYRQMAVLTGARQSGKTTLALQLLQHANSNDSTQRYLNWDNVDHRRIILAGTRAIADYAGLEQLYASPPLLVFDELHKYAHWKDFLKGFFDSYESKVRILITGSASLGTFNTSGDSLMGRYFGYELHPLSVAELLSPEPTETLIRNPHKIPDDAWEQLYTFGGFPEPFLMASDVFALKWRSTRRERLLYEDLRDLSRIQELKRLEVMTLLIEREAGCVVRYSSLAQQVQVSVDSIRRWLDALEAMYFCFRVRPWFNNVRKSLRKDPKVYLNDWSGIADEGARFENMLACHLAKAVSWWNDAGLGLFSLHYLRTTDGKEVDFLIVKDGQPWLMAEAKSAARPLSKHLHWFHNETAAAHVFQVVKNLKYVERDCFAQSGPIQVPARTFLSQLL